MGTKNIGRMAKISPSTSKAILKRNSKFPLGLLTFFTLAYYIFFSYLSRVHFMQNLVPRVTMIYKGKALGQG